MDEVELRFPNATDVELSVRELSITEELSRPFNVSLVTLGSDGSVDLERVAGGPAVVRIDRGALGTRTFTGLCASIEQRRAIQVGGAPDAEVLYRYDVEVVPALWMLRHRRNQRIFQHLSTPDIVLALLSEWGVAAESRVTQAAFPKHEYRVQYAESDLDFVTRLLDEAGISYFFEGPGATVVLSDRTEKSDPRRVLFAKRPKEAAAWPHVTDVRVRGATGPGKFTLGDFDLRRPRGGILYRADGGAPGEDRLERFAYEPGAATIDLDASQVAESATPAADDQSTARTDEEAGYAASRARLAGVRGPLRGIAYGTNMVDLAPGSAIALAGQDIPKLAFGAALVVARSHLERDIEREWRGSGVAVFGDATVRPEPTTPSPRRPRIDGLQSAIVVGPPGEEIYTDEFGRVRVCFQWDRSDGPDERRTCWVRVSEGWSGPAFGILATPRVGNEVVVGFYEGNPDQPTVVGRLHNVVTPAVAALPGAQTRTMWSTSSTPAGGAGDGHHELTFDDQVGRELVLVRSERDLETVVKRELREIAGLDQSIIVGRHHATTIVREDSSVVGQKHEVTIGQIQSMNIAEAGTPAVTPLATRREIIAQRITLTTGGATIELSGPEITITTEQDIHIMAGGTVDIQGGPQVHINPPVVGQGGDPEKAEPPPSHVAWFKLLSEDGTPLAGVRCYIEHADGTTSQPLVTGGDGAVRLPVDTQGSYQVKLGRPPAQGGSS